MTDEKDKEDVSKQPAGNKPGKGGGFAGSVLPDDVPDHVEEEKESKPERNSQGRLGLQVIDEKGEVKQAVEYTRVSGEGSVELKARNAEDGVKWLKTRRDNLPGKEED